MKHLPSLNRSIILLNPTEKYMDWYLQFEGGDESENDAIYLEPNAYLMDEEVLDLEKYIETNFKKMFSQECILITENQEDWPELNLETFESFFEITISSFIFDLEKTRLETFSEE